MCGTWQAGKIFKVDADTVIGGKKKFLGTGVTVITRLVGMTPGGGSRVDQTVKALPVRPGALALLRCSEFGVTREVKVLARQARSAGLWPVYASHPGRAQGCSGGSSDQVCAAVLRELRQHIECSLLAVVDITPTS